MWSRRTCPPEPKKIKIKTPEGAVCEEACRRCSSRTSASARVTGRRSEAGMRCFSAPGFTLSRECSVLHPVFEDAMTSSLSDRTRAEPDSGNARTDVLTGTLTALGGKTWVYPAQIPHTQPCRTANFMFCGATKSIHLHGPFLY